MKNEISKLFEKKNSYSVKELEEILKIEDGKNFVVLQRALNELMDEGHLFMLRDGIYAMIDEKDYFKGSLILKRNGHAFISHEGELLEVSNSRDQYLLNGDEVIYNIHKNRAYILNILKHHIVYVVGILRLRNKTINFYADDPSFPSGYKITNYKQFKLKDRMKVRCYISDYRKKEMKIESIIGFAHDPEVQELSILFGYDVPLEFSNTVLNEAKAIPTTINVEDYPSRKDCTNDLVITIDGDDAKDFDDAIEVKKEADHYILKVHIADVSHYVKEKSALDKEAYKRGTSIYYPGHVIPMLPFELSNEICSLKPRENRLAMTAEMVFDLSGNLERYDLYESVIQSKYRMTYSKVNRILNGDPYLIDGYKEIVPMIHDAYELSKLLRAKREEKGGIDFGQDECEIVLRKGEVIDIKVKERGISEGIIEDFMIEANVCVASHMRYLEYPMIYRNHDYPKEDRIVSFLNFVGQLGYHFKGNKFQIRSKQLQECLASFEGRLEYPVVSNYLLRSMAKARYENTANGHYGLGLDNYCHFTSPIRRYPDLIVHRSLKKYAFQNNFNDFDKDHSLYEKIANSSSEKEKTATIIERDILDLKKCEYMRKHIGETFQAVISSVTSYGFYCKLENTVEGLVHIRNLPGYFEYHENGYLTNGKESYRMGQVVKVKLQEVDLRRLEIDFVLAQRRNRI